MNLEKIKRKISKCKENSKKNIKMKGLTLYIIINILYIFVESYLITISKVHYIQLSKGFIPLLIINVIIGVIICVKGYYKKSINHIFIVLIIIFGGISTIFAASKSEAFFGFRGRYEGLIAIMYYFSLTFLSSFLKKKYKKIVIVTILITGAIQCVYAICQIYEVPGVYRMINSSNKIKFLSDGFKIQREVWATGFTTNPNFFGSYMLLCTTFALGLYIDEKKILKSIIWLVFSVLFLVGILISNAASAAVGLIAVLFYILVYCLKNKYFKKLIIIILAIICVVFGISKLGKTTLVKDVTKTGYQATEIAKGNVDEKYGTNRIYIWKETLKIVPQNLIHGVGVDNYYFAFDGKPLFSKNGKTFYDKAHNEYLQILVTEGIFCLITYIALYGSITFKGIKNSFKNKEIYFIIPVIGYLVQAFFNISVIEVAPIFYIALGMCMTDEDL